MGHEQKVRAFYDEAGPAYETLMGDIWHHGDPAAEAQGMSPREAAQVLERRLVSLAQLKPGDRALDFGSGVGGPTLYMAKITGAFFVGVSNNEWLNLFPGIPCWGSTPPEDRPKWLAYDGPQGERFHAGKHALDAARGAGVFMVGAFAAVRPH